VRRTAKKYIAKKTKKRRKKLATVSINMLNYTYKSPDTKLMAQLATANQLQKKTPTRKMVRKRRGGGN